MSLLQHFIDDSAARNPDAEAFRIHEDSLSYGSLVEHANRVANALLDHGLRRMERVGIIMSKRIELPAAVYGILKAGGVMVPIDPAAPASRVRLILQDCGIRHLISEPEKANILSQVLKQDTDVAHVIGLNRPTDHDLTNEGCRFDSWDAVAQMSTSNPTIASTEQDLAYIMYTSGSTGAPKGLMHTHGSGISYARISANVYDVRPEDRLGNHAALHFDQSTFEFFTGPRCGATTVMISEETKMFPVSLGKLIENERLTFWYSVPLALVRLLEHGNIESIDAGALRWVIFGGEAFPPKYLAKLMQRWPHARFSNSYGPAEVNQCTYYHVPPSLDESSPAIPIGKLWEDTDGLVVDDSDQPVAPGDAGELLVRTPTMMQGYWGRPDLNEAAFYRHERFPGFHEVYYRTGDLVRIDPQRVLHFLGRKDRQIKVRGYRVELDEIESVFCGLPEVAEAAAITSDGAGGATELVVTLMLRDGDSVNSDQLRKAVSEFLPSYAIPHCIEIRAEFPRTTSGKIDRRRLQEDWQTQRSREE